MSNKISCEEVFTWELQDFNIDCLGVELWSPVFQTQYAGSPNQWRIGICVERYGENSAIFFNSRLKCVSHEKPEYKIGCTLSIQATNRSLAQTTDITTWNFSNSAYCVFHDLKLSEDVFFPSDGSFHSLTVRCHMNSFQSCYGDSVASTLVGRCSFPWILEKFLQLQPDQSSKMHLVKKDSAGFPTITLELFFGESGRLHVTVCGPNPHAWSAAFRLHVLDPKKKMFCPYDSFSFCKDHPLSLKRGMLRDDFLSMGVLTLLTECFFVVEVDKHFPYQELLAVKDISSDNVSNYTSKFPEEGETFLLDRGPF